MKHSICKTITKNLCFLIFLSLTVYYTQTPAIIDNAEHGDNAADITFETVKTTVFDEKTRINTAITAINKANLSTDVIDFYLDQDGTPLVDKDNNPRFKLKEEFLAIFTQNIQKEDHTSLQSDDNIREILTLLFVTQITGAIIYMIATHNIEKLKNNPHEKIILTREHILTNLESMGLVKTIDQDQVVTGYHFYDIPVKKSDLDIDEMIKTPILMYNNIYALINALLEAKEEFKKRNYGPFSKMLDAKIKDKSIRNHLSDAAHNIDKLEPQYFENIKTALLELGEAIQQTQKAPLTQLTYDQHKAKITNIIHAIFTEDTQPTEEPKSNKNPEPETSTMHPHDAPKNHTPTQKSPEIKKTHQESPHQAPVQKEDLIIETKKINFWTLYNAYLTNGYSHLEAVKKAFSGSDLPDRLYATFFDVEAEKATDPQAKIPQPITPKKKNKKTTRSLWKKLLFEDSSSDDE